MIEVPTPSGSKGFSFKPLIPFLGLKMPVPQAARLDKQGELTRHKDPQQRPSKISLTSSLDQKSYNSIMNDDEENIKS